MQCNCTFLFSVHVVGAHESAEGCVIARRVGNQLRRFLTPLALSPSSLLAPEAHFCAQRKIRLVHSIQATLIADTARVERCICEYRFTKRVFLRARVGRKAKERGRAREGRKPAAFDAGCRPSRIYAHGDAVHCIHKNTKREDLSSL